MAGARKSARQVQARQRAREKAAEFRAREDQLEHLATEFFVASDDLDQIAERVEVEIARVRERGDRDGQAARVRAEQAVAAMLTLGVSRSEAADRLGVTVRELPRSNVDATAAVEDDADTAPAEVASAADVAAVVEPDTAAVPDVPAVPASPWTPQHAESTDAAGPVHA